MPQDKTADELRRRAAQIRSEAETAARRLEDAADLLERMGNEPLPSGQNQRSLSVAMQQQHLLRREKKGRPIKSKHPFAAAIDRTPDMTVEKWAAKHSLHPKTVKAWYSKGEGGRRIPLAIAEMIAREFVDEAGKTLVPADEATWPNGIRRS